MKKIKLIFLGSVIIGLSLISLILTMRNNSYQDYSSSLIKLSKVANAYWEGHTICITSSAGYCKNVPVINWGYCVEESTTRICCKFATVPHNLDCFGVGL